MATDGTTDRACRLPIDERFITFIGQNGRKIANGFENVTSQMLTETFVFKEKGRSGDHEQAEHLRYLAKQPFMVRHFGTTDLANRRFGR